MYKSDMLASKVIVVTGGGTGLGKSMAKKFGQLGATVIITSRKKDVLDLTTDEFRKSGIDCYAYPCDVRETEQVNQLLDSVIQNHKKVDVLINNAAGNFISPTEMLTTKGFDVVIDIALRGTFNMMHTFGSHWIKTNHPGTVLNISTTYAESGGGYVVPSAAAKAGVNALTRSLAVEWAKYNIRINGIAPGPVPTKGAFSRLMPDQSYEQKIINRMPYKRFGTHDELANLAAFLISDLSTFVNGEIIRMDSGEQLRGGGHFNNLEEIPNELWPELTKIMRKGQGSQG